MTIFEVRDLAARGGHELGRFATPRMGVGPVATCGCGLGVTRPRRRPFTGETWVWTLPGRLIISDSEHPLTVRAFLESTCPRERVLNGATG